MSMLTRAIRMKVENRGQIEPQSWYRIRNAQTGPTQVMIYDEIGDYGVTALDFIQAINGVKGPIELHVNSYGGEVFAGIAIYQALKSRPDPTVCVVDSIAASIASVIAMGCDQVMMARNATMMIHEASGVAIGNAQELLDYADILDKASANIADIYMQRAGGTIDGWRALMRAETWMSASETVAAGLADGIWDEKPPTAAALVVPSAHAIPVIDPPAVEEEPPPTKAEEDDGFVWDPQQIREALKEACNA